MVDLANRLALPQPMDIGERPGIIPQASSDGFAAYPEAVDLAFGSYVRYGQLTKDYRNADQPGRYGLPDQLAGRLQQILDTPGACCELFQPSQRFSGRQAAAAKAGFQIALELRIMFQKTVNQIVIFFKRRQLKGGHSFDSDNDRFAVTQAAVIAQSRLGFTQRDHFHGVHETPLPKPTAGLLVSPQPE
jgi:hypothetical protein